MPLDDIAQFVKRYKSLGLGALLVLLLFVLGYVLAAAILMWAWNAALVPIFGVAAITFWPALGLCILETYARSTMKTWHKEWRKSGADADADAA